MHCPHTNKVLDIDNSELVCISCGEIITEKDDLNIDVERKTKHTEKEITNRKTHMVTTRTLVDFTVAGILTTKISDTNRDYTGKLLKNPFEVQKMKYLNKIINTDTNNEKSFRNAMWHITVMKDKLGLNDAIKERAAELYIRIYKRNGIRGRSVKGLAAAAVLYACKEANIIRNISDYTNALSEKPSYKKELFKYYKILIDDLSLDVPDQVDPITEISRIAGKSGITERSVRTANALYFKLYNFKPTVFFGKSPSAIAVCTLYLATKMNNENIKQEIITKAGEVSTVTLRKRCDEYIDLLKEMGENTYNL